MRGNAARQVEMLTAVTPWKKKEWDKVSFVARMEDVLCTNRSTIRSVPKVIPLARRNKPMVDRALAQLSGPPLPGGMPKTVAPRYRRSTC